MRALLFVLGFSVACGAELQADAIDILLQGAAGLVLCWAALPNQEEING